MTANNAIESTKTRLPKASILYLLIAGLVDLGLAFMPVWFLTAESNLLDHIIQLFRTVAQETVKQPRELVTIFWLPLGASVICFGAMLAALFGAHTRGGLWAIIFTPLAITVGMLVYFFATRADIHIMAISLLPLSIAWWEYYKLR